MMKVFYLVLYDVRFLIAQALCITASMEMVRMLVILEFMNLCANISMANSNIVQQMVVGEDAQCFIKTSNGEEISFIVILERILESRAKHTLTVKEMYERAQHFEENEFAMFKEYPIFAHDYFKRSAKRLIPYKPFTDLTLEADGVSARDMEKLFINIQTNLASSLLAEKRYEDLIYQTEFVENNETELPSEKAIYRRAMAFYCIKEYDKAKSYQNYQEKKEFVKLQQRFVESSKASHDHYKNVVQRMFS